MRINWLKSCIIAIDTPSQDLSEIAEALYCPIWTIRISRGSFGWFTKEKDFWIPVLERCQKNLADWKAKYLSFGYRITLIEVALPNIPVYFLSIFRIPKGIAQELESLQRQFLWTGNLESKPHLIKWFRLPKDKSQKISFPDQKINAP